MAEENMSLKRFAPSDLFKTFSRNKKEINFDKTRIDKDLTQLKMIAVVRCGAGSVEGPRRSTRGTKTIIKNVALVSVVEETHGVETALQTRRTPGTALPRLLRTSFVVPRVWLGPGL